MEKYPMTGDEFDLTIANLYASALIVPLNDFRSAALSSVRQHIPFSSAVWATVRPNINRTADEAGGVIHSITLVDLDPIVPQLFAEQYSNDDAIRASCLRQPGRTFRIEDTMTFTAYRQTALYREMAQHYGIEHAMGTVIHNVAAEVTDFVVLWRADRSQPFGDDERSAKEKLTLHAVNAWQHKQSLSIRQAPDFFDFQQSVPIRPQARALVDRQGVVGVADNAFAKLLHIAFPGWRGPDLPAEFLWLLNDGSEQATFANIDITLVYDGAYVYFTITQSLSTVLSPTEYAVANMFVSGMSNSDIAKARHVSPFTVRNQIASIYEKLNVHSKLELAQLLRDQ
jgi:DNA-binding CsgD family transcriptional regulator